MESFLKLEQMLEKEMKLYMEKDRSVTADKISKVSAALYAIKHGNNRGIERTFLRVMGIDNKTVRSCFRGNAERRDLAESLFNDYKASI